MKTKENPGSSVVLIGMMGSGKSHMGRLLAARLGLDFYDSDALIEGEQGQSVSGIFQSRGEPFFREQESRVIADLLDGPVSVISTGGGAITTPQVLEKIKAQAISIWLRVDSDVLLERIRRGGAKRPLLACDDPKGQLEALLEAREPLYRQADIMIDNSHNDIGRAVDDLDKALQDYMEKKARKNNGKENRQD